MEIKNKVFIVTGAASGLGAGTARMLTAEGAKVVLADLQDEAGQKLAAELGQTYVHCDVTKEEDGQAVVAAARKQGALFGIVNCAGVAPATRIVGKNGAHPLDMFQKVVMINLVGTFNMCRLAAEAMAAAVLRATGSRICRPVRPAPSTVSFTRKRWSSDAMQVMSWFSPESRSSVRCSRLLPPSSGANCLGSALRESGHRRVPLPPHRTTGWMVGLVFMITRCE